MDITYIPMARGFVYLAAGVDWFSRRVLAWRLSITLETEFCLDAVQEALARHGKPEIFNTDQGSRFTGAASTGMLQDRAIRISTDGRGAWRDNVFVERLWRSVRHEEVYLRAYDSVSDARASLGRAGTWPSTMDGGRTRAWARGPRSRPTSATCRSRWRRESAAGAAASLRLGYARPA